MDNTNTAEILPLEQIADNLAEKHGDLVKRTDALLASAGRIPTVVDPKTGKANITDAETSKRLADLINMFTKLITKADNIRDEEKDPYWEGGKAVDGWFSNKIISRAKVQKAELNAIQKRWLDAIEAEETRQRKEAAKKAKDEADRLAAEADAAAERARGPKTLERAIGKQEDAEVARMDAIALQRHAEAKPLEKTLVRGEAGGRQQLRHFTNFEPFEFIDLSQQDILTLAHLIPTAEWVKAARKFADLHKNDAKLDGVKFYPDTRI